MNEDSGPDLLNELAHEFAQRYRRGERPALTDYTNKYPDLAAEIRDLFPAMIVIEAFGSVAGPGTIAHANPVLLDEEPRRLGEYRILREIARGGMGIVYEAVQEPLGRHVAVKMLPVQGAGNANHLERFHREAKAAANLHHTNIVPVFGVGEGNGVHFYAMQFIHGQGLDSVIHELKRLSRPGATDPPATPANPMTVSLAQGLAAPPEQPAAPLGGRAHPSGDLTARTPNPSSGSTLKAVAARPALSYYHSIARIGIQVAEALAYAHGQGVLHRDIKPSNLLLDTQGTVWVTDFGLAKVEGTGELTLPGDIVGTLRYMAPERFQGKGDARSDVYSLGLTLYELLTLRPAFEANERGQLIHRMLHAEAPPPRGIDPRIPPDLETVVLKAIAKEPTRRYQTAAKLAEDLGRFLADRPIQARRSTVKERTWRWCRRNPALALLLGAVAGLLAAVTTVSTVSSVLLRNQLALTQRAQREGRAQLFSSLVAQARAVRLTGRKGQRFEALKVLAQATEIARELDLPTECWDELRNETIAALCLPDVEVAREWAGWPPGTTAVDLDPAFERYARGDLQGNVSVRRVADDVELARLPGPERRPPVPVSNYGGVVFSADGRFLQHLCWDRQGRQRRFRLWDLSGPQPRLVLDSSDVFWATFRADSRQIAVLTGLPTGGQLHIYQTASGCEAAFPRFRGEVTAFSFHPRLPRAAIRSVILDKTWTLVVDLETGKELARWELPGDHLQGWDPEGRRLLTSSGSPDTRLFLSDAGSGKLALPPLIGHRAAGSYTAFNHAGDLLAGNDWSGVLRLWDVRTGRPLFDTPGASLTGMRFSPDDSRLAATVQGSQVRILRVAAGRELRRFAVDSAAGGGFPRVGVSPDGRLLAATAKDGLALYDLARGGSALIPGRRAPLVFESSESLLTHADGPEGLVRWPLRADPAAAERRQAGPSQWLAASHRVGDQMVTVRYGGLERWGASADGRVIAMPNYERGAYVFVADRHQKTPESAYDRITLGPQNDVRFCEVSPDGRWVVTGSHGAPGTVTVWEVDTGRRVKDLLAEAGVARFSPDGRWLAVCSLVGGRLWKVDAWHPGPTFGPGVATFDPESRLLAVETGYGAVRLVVPDTGKELARLNIPDHTRVFPQCFSPDGTRLIAFGVESQEMYVWDLRAIRAQLAERGLDWDQPAYPPPKALPTPLQVKVVMPQE